jgi:hypothetical protein
MPSNPVDSGGNNRRLDSSIARYHSSHKPSRLPSKYVKIRIYKTTILPVVCMGGNMVSDIKGRTD